MITTMTVMKMRMINVHGDTTSPIWDEILSSFEQLPEPDSEGPSSLKSPSALYLGTSAHVGDLTPLNNIKGSRTQIVGLWGPNTIIFMVFGT